MRLLVYTAESGVGHVGKLIGDGMLPQWSQLIVFSKIAPLASWLKERPRNFLAAILLPDNFEALQQLTQLHEYFGDRKVILFYPDLEDDDRFFVNLLRPTYCFSNIGDIANIPSVLKAIMKAKELREKEEAA